ncbi:MATE family efflux transporter [Neiella marina]|uniref:MATE family efflux transporter n=1 Tax=Neiella marina TaxID=508461 RepID=A0A8J2U4M9_9GAMM|nr:MATE family efflux transporter [Neiella marina]GGA75416.1 MATE family efflux transporter [Neiella marina]
MTEATKSLASKLYQMTLPMIVGVLAIMSYQLVDSAFIGQLGVKPLAVVGFTIPVYQLIIGIQVGVGIATTAVISRVLGANDQHQAKQLGSLVVAIGGLLIGLLCVMIWLFQRPILTMLGAEQELLPLASSYWLPWLISAWLGALLYYGYSIYRAHGYTKAPGVVMVISSIINVILDPLFIFTFDMGIAGAAWATIVSFIAGCIIIYPRVIANQWLTLQINIGESLRGLNCLSAIMIPAMASQFIPPTSAMAATAIVASFGENVMAAWGLGTRIEYFSIIVVLALTMAMPPMIGRFRGANDFDSIHRLVVIAVCFVAGFQLLMALTTMVLSQPIGRLLTSDPTVAAIVGDYLWSVPLSYGALGICMVLVSAANAMGKPATALLTSLLRLLCCYLPCLWIGARWGGINGVFWGAAVGNFAAGIVSWQLYRTALRSLRATITPATA